MRIARTHHHSSFLAIAAVAATLGAQSGLPDPRPLGPSATAAPALPMLFFENAGQWDTDAEFLMRHRTFAARFHADGIVLQRESDGPQRTGVAVRLRFEGGAPTQPKPETVLAASVHWFVGKPDQWRQHLRVARSLRYESVWPGVDVVVRESHGELEYDLVLAPGAALAQVRIRCEGADRSTLEPSGTLVLHTPLGEIRQSPPVTFEIDSDGTRHDVASRFVALDTDTYGFAVQRRDPLARLVVDPLLMWSSYIGGAQTDRAYGVERHSNGRLTIVGESGSLFTFPRTMGVYQPSFGGGLFDAFAMQLDPSRGGADQLRWATFLGGSQDDAAWDVDERPSGDLAIVGRTYSGDFPTTPGAFQRALGGSYDAFVTVLSADGTTLTYGTLLGGSNDDAVDYLAVQPDGTIDIAGGTLSSNYPLSANPLDGTNVNGQWDGCVSRIDPSAPTAGQLVYSSYLGVNGELDYILGIAASSANPGRITLGGYVINPATWQATFPRVSRSGPENGWKALVLQLDPSQAGSAQLVFAHILSSNNHDYCYSVGVAANGDVVAAGVAGSGFPTTPGAYRTATTGPSNTFVTRLAADGRIRFCTFVKVGSQSGTYPLRLAVNPDDSVTVAGYTDDSNFPLKDAIDKEFEGGSECFVTRIDRTLSNLEFSTFVGGNRQESVGHGGVEFDDSIVTLVGPTDSTSLPMQNPFQASFQRGVSDGFLYQFDMFRSSGSGAGVPTYMTATHPVGSVPRGVTTGDLDQDGDRDIATANAGSDDVTIRPNDGSGNFSAAPVTVALGTQHVDPHGIAAGDLDGDGAADDLAVTCPGSHNVAIVTNATAAPSVSSIPSAGLRPQGIAVAALDGLAPHDVVVGRIGDVLSGGQGLDVILNGGPAVNLPVPAGNPSRIAAVALADLDRDGDRDLVAIGHGTADALLFYTNDGAGSFTFAFAHALPTSGFAGGLCAADIDGDNDVDVVVALPVVLPSPSQSVRILLYTGSGSLDPADYTTITHGPLQWSGVGAVAAVCGDFDQDTIPNFGGGADVALVNRVSNGVCGLYGFDPMTRTFVEEEPIPSGTGPSAIAAADLNGDTTIDLVIANEGEHTVTVNLTDAVLARVFGSGCIGTGGAVPAIGAIGLPRLGTSFGVAVTKARANSGAFFLTSPTVAPTGLMGGCVLYPSAPIVLVGLTDTNGQARFDLLVPNLSALVGFDLFHQYLIGDPNGAFFQTLAFSNGLRIQIGL